MIDAKKIIDAWYCCGTFNKRCEECPYDKECYQESFHSCFSSLAIAEAVELLRQQQKKTGHWIEECTCSNCHWMHEDDKGFALITTYNYCPSCGAKMVKEEKEAQNAKTFEKDV